MPLGRAGHDVVYHEMNKKKHASSNPAKMVKVMHEFKKGKLKSGSGKRVKNRKQAIAIGLSY